MILARQLRNPARASRTALAGLFHQDDQPSNEDFRGRIGGYGSAGFVRPGRVAGSSRLLHLPLRRISTIFRLVHGMLSMRDPLTLTSDDDSLIRRGRAVGNDRWRGSLPLSWSAEVAPVPAASWSDMVVCLVAHQVGGD